MTIFWWSVMVLGVLYIFARTKIRYGKLPRETDVFTVVGRSHGTYSDRQFQRFMEGRDYGD